MRSVHARARRSIREAQFHYWGCSLKLKKKIFEKIVELLLLQLLLFGGVVAD